jgi:hypothetical protein
MSERGYRIQLVSDKESIGALSQAALADSVSTEPAEIPVSDQPFGLAEAAAIIAIVHTSAEIAALLVKAYKALRGKKKITIKSPKGSLTIEADNSVSAEEIFQQIGKAGIF